MFFVCLRQVRTLYTQAYISVIICLFGCERANDKGYDMAKWIITAVLVKSISKLINKLFISIKHAAVIYHYL